MQAPTQTQINDLSNLLELVRMASNPEALESAIAELRKERKQFDDAIVSADARIKAASEAEALATLSGERIAQLQLELDARQESINAQSNEISVRNAEVDARIEAVAIREGAVAQIEAALKAKDLQLQQDVAVRIQRADDRMNEATQRESEAATKIDEADKAKIEYENLSNRIKSLVA